MYHGTSGSRGVSAYLKGGYRLRIDRNILQGWVGLDLGGIASNIPLGIVVRSLLALITEDIGRTGVVMRFRLLQFLFEIVARGV